jgi:DNA-binding NtrC family response regulator
MAAGAIDPSSEINVVIIGETGTGRNLKYRRYFSKI